MGNSKAATKSYKSLNTLKQYVTLDSTDYWHIQYPWNNKWEEYFWDMSQKAFDCKLKRDGQGITQYIGEDGETYYSMIEVAQYGMASYQAYLKTNEEYWLEESVKHAEFLIERTSTFKKSNCALVNEYPISLYNVGNVWVSALAYGVIISLLVRLYELRGEESYLETAKNLGQNYTLGIEDGGVLRKVPNRDFSFFEEYPSEEFSGVLNGHVTGLWGLYDLGKYEEGYEQLFKDYSIQLADNLDAWDAGFWSYYDLKDAVYGESNLSSAHYHLLHVKQLMIMYQLSGLSAYADCTERFIKYKYSILSRIKAFTKKAIFRVNKDFIKK